MRVVLALTMMLAAAQAVGACRWEWVDHDYNAATPAIQKQVCDSTYDTPAVRTPSVRPIQQPQVRPIQQPSVPPVGTTQCRNESVYENGRWVTKQICR